LTTTEAPFAASAFAMAAPMPFGAPVTTSRCSEIETRFPGLIPSIVSAHRKQITEEAKTAKRKKRA